ncbi:hypothetical protein MUK42_34019 [Musa troglodytarum]|uniref:Uncharacterized protein n=1 Tax=Musa troglodytarum TaxID=320322 RepID=A0A9E7GVS3_9LILI|nr:hypothetical protein MUK42_34019 [Musa troglodytarum]
MPTKEKTTLHAGLLLSSFSFSMAQTSTSIAPHHVDPIAVSFDHIPIPSPKGKLKPLSSAMPRVGGTCDASDVKMAWGVKRAYHSEVYLGCNEATTPHIFAQKTQHEGSN